jgi:Tfp pilus assembly protein PilO
MPISIESLSKEKPYAIPIAIVVAGVLLFYFVLLGPLARQVGTKLGEYRTLRADLTRRETIIKSAGSIDDERVLMTEKEASRAMDELTKFGKASGVNFTSIGTKDIDRDKSTHYLILPIEIETESTYKQLGAFLGSLDEMNNSLVQVKSFDIAPNKNNPSRFRTKLLLDMYLSKRRD